MLLRLFITTSLALCSAAPAVAQDETDLLVLADGQEIECRVLYDGPDKIVYRARRKTQEIAPDEVAEVRSIERSLRVFLERFDAIAPEDVGALGDLALYCEQEGLAGEARNLWIRILTLDPENERAWTRVGGSHGRKGWRLKVRGRYYTLEQLRERVSDWKNAMELRSAHFLLKTDIAPEFAVDVTVDLERAYLAFYDLMNPHMELYVFDELPEVHVYSDAEQYPVPPTPGDAWFSPAQNIVYVNGAETRDRHKIAQTMTYSLIFNSFRRTLGKSGQVSPWAARGLAEAFAAAYRPSPGRAQFDFSSPYRPYFQAQAQDEQPLSLEKVLRTNLASFDSGPDAERYVVQSYTLVAFLARGAEGRYRPGLVEFLKSSFLGQGAATHFRRAMGDVDLDELEAEWKAYVAEVAAG